MADQPPEADPVVVTTGADLLTFKPALGRFCGPIARQERAICPSCKEYLNAIGITQLVYTFEVCTCRDAADYDHLVEQLWHRTCFPQRQDE